MRVLRCKLSNFSQPASQPRQPASQPSGHRSLRPPGIDVSKLFYRVIQSVLIRFHRRAQAATGPQTFWHPQHQGAAKHATNPSNIDDITNFPANIDAIANFPANRVMGRLWDDHFMDLGYPSKFYGVQDAIFIDGSSN